MLKNSFFILITLISFSVNAQFSIGASSADNSSQLDVVSTNKGILIPRVRLTGTTDTTTITNGNKNSLMVYNTATVRDVTPGYYYWQTNAWKRVINDDDLQNASGSGGRSGSVVNISSRGAGTNQRNYRLGYTESVIIANIGVSTINLGTASDPKNKNRYILIIQANTGTSSGYACTLKCTGTGTGSLNKIAPLNGPNADSFVTSTGTGANFKVWVFSDGANWYVHY